MVAHKRLVLMAALFAPVPMAAAQTESCDDDSGTSSGRILLQVASHRGDRVRPSLEVATGAFPDSAQVLRQLDSIYEGHANDTFFHARPDPTGSKAAEVVVAEIYGELLPTAVIEMLAEVGAEPGQRYYDLGSGTGKTVVVAGLLGLNATGVEIVTKRFDGACGAVRHANRMGFRPPAGGHVSFRRGSFLEVDFSDADVVFTDSVEFSSEMLEGLAKTARRMRPGAKVISAQGLPGPGFQDAGLWTGAASWDDDMMWTIQTVTGASTNMTASLADEAALATLAPGDKCELH